MQTITLKEFKGINLDEKRWAEAYAAYTYGMDIFGTGKNSSQLSRPGVLQNFFYLSAGAQAASPSAVTELPIDFATYESQDFAIGTANPGRIYRRDSSTWKWVSAITVSSCASNSAGLMPFGSVLAYAQQAYLGLYDNTNSNANFGLFADTSTGLRPMKVLNGSLYVGNGRYVAKYNGTTFTNTALTLPADFDVGSLEVIGDRLFIMASNGQFSRLFLWDGTSNTYETSFDLLEESTAPRLRVAGGQLWLVGVRGISVSGTPIYIFTGTTFDKVMVLPIVTTQVSGITEWGGGLVVASSVASSSSRYEDGVAGIWMIARHSAEYPYYSALAFTIRNVLNNKTIGAVIPHATNLMYAGVQDLDTSTYEIFEMQSGSQSIGVWQSLPIDAGNTTQKQWHAVRIDAEPLAAGQTVVVKYRLDGETSWTTLTTFSTANEKCETVLPVGKTSRQIELRVELTNTLGQTSTRLHGISLDFTVGI